MKNTKKVLFLVTVALLRRRMPMKNTKKVLFLVTVALLVIAFGVSAFMVIKYMVDGKRQEDRYDDLQSIVSQNTTAGTEAASKPTEATTQPTQSEATEPTMIDLQSIVSQNTTAGTEAASKPTEATTQPTQSEATEPTMIPGYAEIYAQNPHTVGWLKIEGTKLNYPVLQSPDQPNTQSEATEPTMIPGYAEIYAQNPHTVGWLKIEGTKLNYPVLQSPDQPNFYLDHDFDGKSSKGGAIYAREECDINKPRPGKNATSTSPVTTSPCTATTWPTAACSPR